MELKVFRWWPDLHHSHTVTLQGRHDGTEGSVAASLYHGPVLIRVSRCAQVGFFWVLQFPLTTQKHAGGLAVLKLLLNV